MRRTVIALAFGIQSIAGMPFGAHAGEPLPAPPFDSDGEVAVGWDVPPLPTCVSVIRKLAVGSNLTLGIPAFTRSERWGPVMRVDFTHQGESLTPLISRIICWQEPTGDVVLNVQFGQLVPPLKAEP